MKGIRQDSHSYQAFVRAAGQFRSKRFPKDTPIREMQLWRDTTRLRLLGRIAQDTTDGETFADDVRTYLLAVAGMRSYRDRADDMARWVRLFGTRSRHDIAAPEIRAQLVRWRQDYAANTVNHRRTALMHFYTVMNGKSGANPVRDVPRYDDESQDAPPRALSLAALDAILEQMPPCQTRAWLELFRWTGWPPAQIARIRPKEDIKWDVSVYVRPRRKGKGAKGRTLSLLPQAWDALREFKRWHCWGEETKDGKIKYISTSAVRKSFRLAARKAQRAIALERSIGAVDRSAARRLWAELRNVTPYQIRHTFGELVASQTKDDRAVQTLMQHADLRTTQRYTKGTVDPRADAALEAVSVALRARRLPDGKSELPERENTQE